MTEPTAPVSGELAERARRITRDRSYTELIVGRDVIPDGTPVFARTHSVRVGREGGHAHAVDWVEVAAFTRGHGEQLCARGCVAVRAGSVLAVRPGAWHQTVDCDLESAVIGISPVLLAGDLSFLRSRPGVRDLLFSSPRAVRGILVSTVEPRVAREFAVEVRRLARLLRRRPYDHVTVLGQLIVAIGVLSRALPDSGRDRVIHPAVEATLARIESEPEHPWRLEELARRANLDAAYLVRIFRSEVGIPPMTHLAHVRVERAAALLADPGLSIAQVGEAVGWPDSAHFSRRFRSLMGRPPRTYREDLRRSPIDGGRAPGRAG